MLNSEARSEGDRIDTHLQTRPNTPTSSSSLPNLKISAIESGLAVGGRSVGRQLQRRSVGIEPEVSDSPRGIAGTRLSRGYYGEPWHAAGHHLAKGLGIAMVNSQKSNRLQLVPTATIWCLTAVCPEARVTLAPRASIVDTCERQPFLLSYSRYRQFPSYFAASASNCRTSRCLSVSRSFSSTKFRFLFRLQVIDVFSSEMPDM